MSLADEYYQAVKSGNTGYANYLAQILASQAGININTNTVTAAPLDVINGLPALPAIPAISGQASGGVSLGSAADAILQGILHPLDTLSGKNAGTTPPPTVSGIGSGVGSALGFITDIPRVATSVLGLILIIAGIFALSRGPAINIVSSAIKTAATS